ncbi:EF-hand domain-containing protein [Brevundimonas albigilva]|nr:EF-hand domain-containing protein [Brevundimonas albigilva]UQV18680.1 EF-hand domain-containing protein [Brevundimonas albigilva]
MALAAVVGLALGAAAVPALAQALSPSRAAFERLDRDHDGLLTFEEFRLR